MGEEVGWEGECNVMGEDLVGLVWEIKRIFLEDGIMRGEMGMVEFGVGSGVWFYSVWCLWEDLKVGGLGGKGNGVGKWGRERLVEGSGMEGILRNYKLGSVGLS